LLLRRLSQASGLRLLTNTGYYGAADNKFLPAHAFTESAAQLAARWTAEWRYGIEGTDIRPGFIKIGVGAGKLSEVHRKLALAAALTHLETGLAITSHTGNGEAVLDQLAVLKQAGVRAEAFIWVHAQAEPNRDLHVRAAEAGAWVEFDGLNGTTVEQHVQLTQNLRQRGLLGRVLVSHDAGWFHVGEPRGGEFRPFDTLFTQFLPALRAAGFASVELRQLTETNPQTAFTLRQRESQRDSGR
jgi:phosphotriesterase-related protein